MANRSQFDEFEQPGGFDEQRGAERRPGGCAVCETMLPEAVDGLLTDAEQLAFDKHVANCAECARELADARRGAAWLGMLKSRAPEPPAGLLAKILSETTGAVERDPSVAASSIPVAGIPSRIPVSSPTPGYMAPGSTAPGAIATIPAHFAGQMEPGLAARKPHAGFNSQWMALRHKLGDVFSIENARTTFQPRLAMTAAMAFFSIALTLNLTGVRLRDLRASNFTPSSLMRTMADTEASATRLFQNNRAVYQVESRLSELRSDDAPEPVSPAGRR